MKCYLRSHIYPRTGGNAMQSYQRKEFFNYRSEIGELPHVLYAYTADDWLRVCPHLRISEIESLVSTKWLLRILGKEINVCFATPPLLLSKLFYILELKMWGKEVFHLGIRNFGIKQEEQIIAPYGERALEYAQTNWSDKLIEMPDGINFSSLKIAFMAPPSAVGNFVEARFFIHCLLKKSWHQSEFAIPKLEQELWESIIYVTCDPLLCQEIEAGAVGKFEAYACMLCGGPINFERQECSSCRTPFDIYFPARSGIKKMGDSLPVTLPKSIVTGLLPKLSLKLIN